MMQLTDESTPRENTSGSPPSVSADFEALMKKSYSRAYSAAYRMMGNATDAEDLTQEAFVRVWAAFDRYDRSRPFEGWLFRILSNLAIDRWRRQAGLPMCSLDADCSGGQRSAGRNARRAASGIRENRGSTLSTCLADDRPSTMPELSYLRTETGNRVRKALSALPFRLSKGGRPRGCSRI